VIIKSRRSQYRQKVRASIVPCIARWHRISRVDQKRTSHARRKSAMFNRARWQRWRADSLRHRSSDKWKDATHVLRWQAAKKKTRQGGGNTRRRFFLQELELKKLTRSFIWTPCRENDFANQDVRQAHKIRSPEAMTGLTNLIASPNPWQLQKHATNIIRTRPSWADMPS
jgi:hypothetical protein